MERRLVRAWARAHVPFPIWAALTLIVCEYLALGVAFDAEPLAQRTDSWRLAGHLGWLAVLVVSASLGAALVLLSDQGRLQQLAAAHRPGARALPVLAAHVAVFAAFWWVSAGIFSVQGPPPGLATAWLAVWALFGILAAMSAVAAAIPLGRLWPFAAESWPALAAGVAIGAGAWVAGQSSALLWWPLGPWTVRAVGWAVGAFVPDPVFDPSQALIGSERFRVEIAPVCSGYEGVGLMAVFAGAYLVLARRQLRFPQALLLLPAALAAAWLANVARLVLLVLVGTLVSEDIALGGFHARAGWLFFSAAALLLVLLMQRVRLFARDPSGQLLSHPTAAYVLPFVVLVAAAMVAGLPSKYVDLLYGLRLVAVAPLFIVFRGVYRGIDWSWSWFAVAAGLAAGLAFAGLTPKPELATIEGWRDEWTRLPVWGQVFWLAVRAAGSVSVVPLAEELAFRGYLLRRLVSREFEAVPPGRFSLWALLGSSAAFGAIHHGWVGGAIAGLLFGIVQIRRRSIGEAVFAHAVSNAAVAASVLCLGQWWLWM